MNYLISPVMALWVASVTSLTVTTTAHAAGPAGAFGAGHLICSAAGALKRLQPVTRGKPVCCKTRSGFAMLLPERCRQVRGTPASEDRCRQPVTKLVCCRTIRGHVAVHSQLPASKCMRARGKLVDRRFCLMQAYQHVCCRISEGAKTFFREMRRLQCKPPAGQIVPDKWCHILGHVPDS